MIPLAHVLRGGPCPRGRPGRAPSARAALPRRRSCRPQAPTGTRMTVW